MVEEIPTGVLKHFTKNMDGRSRKPSYPLDEIMLVALCAMVSGADDWTSISLWGKAHLEWLRKWRPFKSGVASHDTFGRVFALLNAQSFERCFIDWMSNLCPALGGDIAIDGKTVRRSHARGIGKSAIHMVSAFVNAHGVSVGQIKTAEKSNEITAIPELLNAISVKDSLVTIDAMGNQRKIAKTIIERGGDYLLAVKKNQCAQFEAIKDFFDIAEDCGYANVKYDQHQHTDKSHGRIEISNCVVVSQLVWLEAKLRWKDMRSIIMVKAERIIAGKSSIETRYYVTPVNPMRSNLIKASGIIGV